MNLLCTQCGQSNIEKPNFQQISWLSCNLWKTFFLNDFIIVKFSKIKIKKYENYKYHFSWTHIRFSKFHIIFFLFRIFFVIFYWMHENNQDSYTLHPNSFFSLLLKFWQKFIEFHYSLCKLNHLFTSSSVIEIDVRLLSIRYGNLRAIKFHTVLHNFN